MKKPKEIAPAARQLIIVIGHLQNSVSCSILECVLYFVSHKNLKSKEHPDQVIFRLRYILIRVDEMNIMDLHKTFIFI